MQTHSTAALSRAEAGVAADCQAAPAASTSRRFVALSQRDRIGLALTALLLASFAVQLLGVFNRNVNWDEFLFLTNIHRVANGDSVGLLQSFHTHFFGWLTRLGGDEITQITTARALYLVVWTGSLGLLYRLARHLLDPLGALAGVALFAVYSYSLSHAASFRIDGLVLPVLLAVALLLLKPTAGRVAAAGALSAVAVALTIKAVLWAPAFIGVLTVGLWHEQNRLKPLIAGAAAAGLTLAAIMLAHFWLLSTGDGAAATVSPQRLSHTASRMLLEDGLLPRFDILAHTVSQNLATWLLLAAGLVLAVAELRRSQARRKALVLLLLALPIASVVFYANAWPYAYVVLMPTACLLAGHAFSRWLCPGESVRFAAWGVCLAAAVPMVVSAWSLRSDQQAHQKQILSIVHGLFDEPVAYIDKGGMVASFPKQPIFLSRWGLKNYRDGGVPVFARYVRQAQPPLLIVNTAVLDVWNEIPVEQVDPSFRLFAEDAEALRATYAPYWGEIYLAGRQWRGLGGGESLAFDIVIAGDYTLIARQAASVDGRTYAPGATLSLAAGPHTLQATGPEPDLRLLWGRGTAIPAHEPGPVPIYTGF